MPATRYAKSGDVNIAYQVVGDGPVDLVYVPGFVSNIELMWEDPGFTRFFDRLASFARLVIFDKRGTGLSDAVSLEHLPTLEVRMDDLRAVMDAVGSENAFLFGHSEGGNMCVLFAASYPQRVSGLDPHRLLCEADPQRRVPVGADLGRAAVGHRKDHRNLGRFGRR